METNTTDDPFNDDDAYLEWLNDEFAATKLGGVIFVGILMVIGIIGNLHVLYIYALKFKKSTHRIYILCLAMVDTVTCCIGMPFVIVDLQNPLLFRAIAVCKILRFLNYFMCSSSAILLVVIAVDRYKNICHPFEVQMTERKAKIACGISLMIGLILSWPAPILYGASTVGTKTIASYLHIEVKNNTTGTQCFTVDKFFGTPYQTIFNVVLIGIILILTTVLGVLYSLICRAVILQAKNFHKMTKSMNNGLKTTAGPIYKNEYPQFTSERTSSSVDSRSTLSEGMSDTPKGNTNIDKICGDSHEGVKQNVHNICSDIHEGVKQNSINDQNIIKCIYVSNVDDAVIGDSHVVNNQVYQNVTRADDMETAVSKEYQNVYSSGNEESDHWEDHDSEFSDENQECEFHNAEARNNGTEVLEIQDGQQEQTSEDGHIGNTTSDIGLGNGDEVSDSKQEGPEENTYRNDILVGNSKTNNEKQRRTAYENVELKNCGNEQHTLNQNTYENIIVKENGKHRITVEDNVSCSEENEENLGVREVNGEPQNSLEMDLVENKLTKETNFTNKHQCFDVSVTTNRGQVNCKASDKNTYINVRSNIVRQDVVRPDVVRPEAVRPDVTKTPKTKKTYNRERQAKRITLMLFIITLVFVLSFTPHLTLKILAFVRKDFLTSLSYTQLVLYHTFVWSFFINNMANPIIYGFCDSVFRKEIKKTYKYCFQKCKSCVKYRSYRLN